MSGYSVQDEYFCIINASAREICKLGGSIREFVSLMTCCLAILSIAFITREVRARSEVVEYFGGTFLGMGLTVENFHI